MSRLRDPVYGAVTLDAPLLRDLYHSEAVQRLGDVYQGGITAFIKPERRTTRLEHSVGVMTLLRRLGAGVEEQAAGLIHDVPHTAFSHVVDFVFPNRTTLTMRYTGRNLSPPPTCPPSWSDTA